MRAVITGGAGFIGSNIASTLVADGHEVAIIDNFSTGRRSNLDSLQGKLILHEGSILDDALLEKAFAGADVVFHEAALPSVARSVEDPFASHEANARTARAPTRAVRCAASFSRAMRRLPNGEAATNSRLPR